MTRRLINNYIDIERQTRLCGWWAGMPESSSVLLQKKAMWLFYWFQWIFIEIHFPSNWKSKFHEDINAFVRYQCNYCFYNIYSKLIWLKNLDLVGQVMMASILWVITNTLFRWKCFKIELLHKMLKTWTLYYVICVFSHHTSWKFASTFWKSGYRCGILLLSLKTIAYPAPVIFC